MRPKYCPNCGQKVSEDGHSFCRYCNTMIVDYGKRIEELTTQLSREREAVKVAMSFIGTESSCPSPTTDTLKTCDTVTKKDCDECWRKFIYAADPAPVKVHESEDDLVTTPSGEQYKIGCNCRDCEEVRNKSEKGGEG